MTLQKQIAEEVENLQKQVRDAAAKFTENTGMYAPVIEVIHLDTSSLDGKSWVPHDARALITNEIDKGDD